MRYVTITLAFISAACGLYAAILWLRSTRVNNFPRWGLQGAEPSHQIEPVDPASADREMIIALLKGVTMSGVLNKWAAIFTAISVAFSGAAAFTGALAS